MGYCQHYSSDNLLVRIKRFVNPTEERGQKLIIAWSKPAHILNTWIEFTDIIRINKSIPTEHFVEFLVLATELRGSGLEKSNIKSRGGIAFWPFPIREEVTD